jgi:hypothetical protein
MGDPMHLDPNILAVLLSFALYALFLLLPLLPAVVIFRMFPDSTVAASGPLSGLRIDVTGAFGAYVVTAVLGYFLVHAADQRISTLLTGNWTIDVPVQLVDADGQEVSAAGYPQLMNFLDVSTQPEVTRWGHGIRLTVPGGVEVPKYFIRFRIPDFGEQFVDTSTLSHDDGERTLTVDSAVTIQKISEADEADYAYVGTNSYQTPSDAPN